MVLHLVKRSFLLLINSVIVKNHGKSLILPKILLLQI